MGAQDDAHSGAAYRYRWTPKPNIFVPAPPPRLSGIVNLAKTEKSRSCGRASLVIRRVTRPRGVLHRGLLARRSRRGRALRALARARRAHQGRARRRPLRPRGAAPARVVEIGCGDGALLRSWRGMAGRDVRRLRALPAGDRARARPRHPARRPPGGLRRRARARQGRRLRPRGALARPRARARSRAAARRGRARRRATCWSRCRWRPTAPPRGRPSAPRPRASGTCTPSTAARCMRSSPAPA